MADEKKKPIPDVYLALAFLVVLSILTGVFSVASFSFILIGFLGVVLGILVLKGTAKKGLGVFIVVSSSLVILGSRLSMNAGDDTAQETQQRAEQQPLEVAQESPTGTPVAYEIVETEDQSHKAIGQRSLSEYTAQELVRLPMDKKVRYRVVVPPDIKTNQVRPTLEALISDITSKDNDIDEISVLLYSDKELTKGGYDVAMAIWAPGGDLGNVDAGIAESNDRTGYELSINVVANLEKYLEQRGQSEEQFGFTEEQRRQIFKELVAAEDRAEAEAERIYPMDVFDPNYKAENIDKHFEKSDELAEKYEAEVRAKYGISEEIEKQISVEGLTERWPMD